MIEFDEFFSNGLVQPPTRYLLWMGVGQDADQEHHARIGHQDPVVEARIRSQIGFIPVFRIHGSSTHVMLERYIMFLHHIYKYTASIILVYTNCISICDMYQISLFT